MTDDHRFKLLGDVIEEAEANIGGLRSSANPTCDW
eukprot:CAMPEP_0185790848 /NCGR_PEP_ID=MMETSP1174-20130828/158034_1 /TAXON_ID=35687 /ORGANISM="Dictyocha speculum, Strain CCMP1381" /LENGTH=34 /DNA_ID= /DNA_START= /DNA_END= /DNA_ORIENTATION=